MRYLSIDIESTGLDEDCHIIEFAAVPFCSHEGTLEKSLSKRWLVKCPPYKELEPKLDLWVRENIRPLIEEASTKGSPLTQFKSEFQSYLESHQITQYFNGKKIVLFGKSMNAIDLPFLNRDLGWDFMRKYFSHRTADLTTTAYSLIDLKFLPPECESGSQLMTFLGMGDVAHTALEDAENTALMYLKILKQFAD